MIAEDGFLRRLPVAVDDRQAVYFEALVFATDTIESSMGAIRRIATLHREKVLDAGRPVRTELFTHAWTVVDCLHVVLQAMRALNYSSPRTTEFFERHGNARTLRNKMDHLTGNAKNVAEAKGRPPIFGAFSYLCIADSNITTDGGTKFVTGAGVVTLSTGRITAGQSMTAFNPLGRNIEGLVGGFQLDALGERIILEDAVRELEPVLRELEDHFSSQFVKAASQLAKEHGVALDSLTGHGGSGVSVYMEVAFDEPTPLVEVSATT